MSVLYPKLPSEIHESGDICLYHVEIFISAPSCVRAENKQGSKKLLNMKYANKYTVFGYKSASFLINSVNNPLCIAALLTTMPTLLRSSSENIIFFSSRFSKVSFPNIGRTSPFLCNSFSFISLLVLVVFEASLDQQEVCLHFFKSFSPSTIASVQQKIGICNLARALRWLDVRSNPPGFGLSSQILFLK